MKTQRSLVVNGKEFTYFSIKAAQDAGMGSFARLPVSLKILLENLLRHLDNRTVTLDDIQAIATWLLKRSSHHEIAYRPARVLMQDFTGVPAIVDLAAMRAAMTLLKSDPEKINPLVPVDLVIDHSVQVDAFGLKGSFLKNIDMEMHRNKERYEFLRWGQNAFHNFRVVPPGTGICHQVNLEYLAQVVWMRQEGNHTVVYPDTLVGTDSHTTMINGLGVLGWGVGGIEAEAAMLGQPISMLIPEVVGVRLTGKLREGIIATDLVLTITEMLRQHGVVGKFVEFFGEGLENLPLADRATIANMAPEYGATCGFFPIDQETIDYLHLTGRDANQIALVEAYCKEQGLWHDPQSEEPVFTDILELDLSNIVPNLAGPKRPQDRVPLTQLGNVCEKSIQTAAKTVDMSKDYAVKGENYTMHHGDVVIAAITSCTNTSNPSALMAAGLLAKKAIEKGLTTKPWVKTSLAPGSKVVTDYLQKAELQTYLDQLGFNLVGYGCTTCIGNSGPLADAISQTITDNDLVVSAVLSGNRNFEGRVHPLTKQNWLASPPLVVAFALAGTVHIDLTTQPLGHTSDGKPVYLKDIWPTNKEIALEVQRTVSGDMFRKQYANVFSGDKEWQELPMSEDKIYHWDPQSTYVRNPPYFLELSPTPAPVNNIANARVLALLGDSITTDHISPAGSIREKSPAGQYLLEHGVPVKEFNSYGARRGNHEVMMRGTFANIRIRNEMVPSVEGGYTRHIPSNEVLSIFDAAMAYQQEQTPLVIIAGKEYGTGSSRDWAAKGTLLLGVKAVIAESFERIHRSNLVGMGVAPFEFTQGMTRQTLQLTGDETITILGLSDTLKPRMIVTALITRANGEAINVPLLLRIDTEDEVNYFYHGGILPYVLRNLAKMN